MTSSSTLAVTNGSSIDGNTATVRPPASLSPLSSWSIHHAAIAALSL